MNIYNANTFQKKPYTMFILTFLGYEYFMEWSSRVTKSNDIQFVIVDTGQQQILETIKDFPIFQLGQNIGCAGGWNFICNLGFNYYGLDKLIVGQDDAVFTEPMIASIWEHANDDMIAGAYDRSFEFSIYGITKNYWNTVGFFDENFMFAGCEDNDYKQRAKLLNKNVKSLNYSADLNISICSKVLGDDLKPSDQHNANYIQEKWGKDYEYKTPFNDPNLTPSQCIIRPMLTSMYKCDVFPSTLEFDAAMELLK